MIFSYHAASNKFNAAILSNQWKTCTGWDLLKRAILKVPISGCVWSNGERKKTNFLYSDFLFLDFDEGKPIEEVKNLLEGVPHVIATTKSHQVSKSGGQPCDRFRVVVPWERKIISKDDYEYSVSKHVQLLDCDKACVDAARFFFPCTEIVSCIDPFDGAFVADVYQQRIEKIPQRTRETPKGPRLKKYIHDFLEHGNVFGSGRNNACFVTAKELRSLGFSEGESLDMISGSPFSRTNFKNKEIAQTVSSAYK